MPQWFMPQITARTEKPWAVLSVERMGAWMLAYALGCGVVVSLVSALSWLSLAGRWQPLSAQIMSDLAIIFSPREPYFAMTGASMISSASNNRTVSAILVGVVGVVMAFTHLSRLAGAAKIFIMIGILATLLLYVIYERKQWSEK